MEEEGLTKEVVMVPRNKRLFIAFVFGILLISCDAGLVFEENRPLENAVWRASEPQSFSFEILDTVSPHNLYVNIRNGDDYPYMNIFLFVEIKFPNGKTASDTLECVLADSHGKWLGSGLGAIHDNRILYRKNTSFPVPGQYEVQIAQAMRNEELASVYDVGLRIARISP
jgi:gliding motility-associated lipoprotein GldH